MGVCSRIFCAPIALGRIGVRWSNCSVAQVVGFLGIIQAFGADSISGRMRGRGLQVAAILCSSFFMQIFYPGLLGIGFGWLAWE